MSRFLCGEDQECFREVSSETIDSRCKRAKNFLHTCELIVELTSKPVLFQEVIHMN